MDADYTDFVKLIILISRHQAIHRHFGKRWKSIAKDA